MRLRSKALLMSLLAAAATLVSSTIPGTAHLVYPGTMDCAQGCDFVAGGWPFRYLVDRHGISVPDSVSLLSGLLGEDILYPGLMAATYAFWLALFAAGAWLAAWSRRDVA